MMGRKTKARLRSPLSIQPLTQIDSQVGDHVDSLSNRDLDTSFNLHAARRQSAHFHHHNTLSQLQPITSFSPMQVNGGDAAVGGGLSTNMNRGIVRNSTIIEILIRLLCQERETDPNRREMLFRALCTVIEQSNTSFYSPLHAYPQLQDFQTNLMEKFEMLFKKAQKEIPSNSASIAVPSLHLPASLLICSTLPSLYHMDDRYAREFIELEVLGRGGFGVVVKAQNKLDGCFYAIKIITLDQSDSSNSDSLLREVQALARLDHPHVVRYHCTWAQFYVLPPHLSHSDQLTEKFERRLQRRKSDITKPKISKVSALPTLRIKELSSTSEGEVDEETSGGISFQEENMSKNKITYTPNVPRTCNIVYKEIGKMNCNFCGLEIVGNKKRESAHSHSFQKSLEFVNRREVSTVNSYQPIDDSSFSFNKFSSKENFHTKSSSDESIVFCDNDYNSSKSKSQTSFRSWSKKSGSSSFENIVDVSSEKDAVAVWSQSRYSGISSYEACGKPIISYHPLANREQQLQRHSHIPQMTLFIQMGLCGESLKDWLQRRSEFHTSGSEGKRFSVDQSECLGLFKQMLMAIQYIHSQNIIHRDVKPANIFFTLDGRHIQLGDFGLARPLPEVIASRSGETDIDQSTLTPISEHALNTHGVGTPIYAAPELKIGHYDAKSDMHNLGIILLELFQPFQTGSERIHVINSLKSKRHLDQDLIISSPDIAPWILKLTDPEPGKRPSASEVLKSSLFRIPSLEGQRQLYHTQHSDIRSSNSITIQRTDVVQNFYSSVKLEDHDKGLLKEKSEEWERIVENAKLKEENIKLKEMVAKLQEQIEKQNSSEANEKPCLNS